MNAWSFIAWFILHLILGAVDAVYSLSPGASFTDSFLYSKWSTNTNYALNMILGAFEMLREITIFDYDMFHDFRIIQAILIPMGAIALFVAFKDNLTTLATSAVGLIGGVAIGVGVAASAAVEALRG